MSGNIAVAAIDFPAPMLKTAIYPAKKGDEEKINTGLTEFVKKILPLKLLMIPKLVN